MKSSVGVNPQGRSVKKVKTAAEWQPPRASGREFTTPRDGNLEYQKLEREEQNPLPDTSNADAVYNTFPETTIRAARGGLLMKGLKLSTLKQDEHGNLHGSDCWSVIPYVHGEDYCIVVSVLQASVELT
jgi:hypothetical protein